MAPRDLGDSPMQGTLLAAVADAGAALASSLGDDAFLLARLNVLAARLRAERLQLAVLGQFKRGKSSFLNGLLGAPLLPTGVVPVTAIPTYLEWGAQPLVEVSFHDGRAPERFHPPDAEAARTIVARFVAEDANPENRLNVSRVRVSYPAIFLRGGIVLIDMPGIGSTLRHNTDAALNVLPECDAALFVLSVDPPITEAEIQYLRQIEPHAQRIFFVLNKFDSVPPAERQAAANFLRKALETAASIATDDPIFCVSARLGLAAKQAHDAEDLRDSGMAAVEDHLSRHLAGAKMAMLREAVGRKAADILSEAAADLALRVRAFELPLETLDARAAAFEEQLRDVESRRVVTRDIVSGERRRIGEGLETRAAALRGEAPAAIVAAVAPVLARDDPNDDAIAAAVAAATADFFDRAYRQARADFLTRGESAVEAHRCRIDELATAVRAIGAALFELPATAALADDAVRAAPEPYWVSERWDAGLGSDLRRSLDRLLPAARRRERRKARVAAQVGDLAVRNVENLRWSILRGLDQIFGPAAGELELRLDDVIGAIGTAIERARTLRRDGSDRAALELDRLRAAQTQLARVHANLDATRHG